MFHLVTATCEGPANAELTRAVGSVAERVGYVDAVRVRAAAGGAEHAVTAIWRDLPMLPVAAVMPVPTVPVFVKAPRPPRGSP